MTRTREENAADAAHEARGMMHIDDIELRVLVKASFIITCGLHSGPLTRENVGELVDNQIAAAGGIQDFIEKVKVLSMEIDGVEQVDL